MIETAQDLVSASLRKIGVLAAGEVASYADANDALTDLNSLLDGNAAERLQIYSIFRSAFSLRANVSEYLVGLGPDQQQDTADGFDSDWTGAPPGWTATTTGNGQITDDTTTAQAGGRSINMTGTGAATASLTRDFVVPAGSSATIGIWLMASFSSIGFVDVTNLTTGNTLTSSGTWDPAASTDVFDADAGIVFVEHSLTFDVESAAIVGADYCTLRVTLRAVPNSFDVWFDTFTFSVTGVPCGIERPTFIDHVSYLDMSIVPNVEIPLTKLTDDGWAAVVVKDMESSVPGYWYYNPTFPYGTLTLWPVPTGTTLQAVLYVPKAVPRFTAPSDTFTLPAGYERMLVTNLALELCPAYGATPNPLLVKQAADSMAVVKRANRRISDLSFPAGALIGSRYGRGYNIRSDR